MRTYRCSCDNMLFFDNSRCLVCGKDVGYCPACQSITALEPQGDGAYRCGNARCGSRLVKCTNYETYDVCNRCITIDAAAEPASRLCDCCSFTQTIPDLSVPGNVVKWYRLEAAKRRLLYDLDLVGLPYHFASDDPRPQLRFDFKADVPPKTWMGWTISQEERVFTGHASGLITINIREADDAEREQARVNLGEAHRTLIGHFRHEIAHYYFEVLVRGRDEDRCKTMFGDHENPTYQDALTAYYQNGPLPNWRERFVSAYATMHPWEDFAETFATYLDMASVLDCARNNGFIPRLTQLNDVDAMMLQYKALGVGMNEINRSMGLLDLVPEVLVEPVRAKMRYIHELVANAAS
ncbi:MAG: putative zinc-binding metallopeptidase [Isosphaeraceae bacterium]